MFLFFGAQDAWHEASDSCQRQDTRIDVLFIGTVAVVTAIVAIVTLPITGPLAIVEGAIRFLMAPATCHVKRDR